MGEHLAPASGIDLFGDTSKANPIFLRARDDLHDVRQATPKPFQFSTPHHEVSSALQYFQTMAKLLPNCSLAARCLFVDGTNPSQVRRVALQVQVLVIRRNAGIADPLIYRQLSDVEKMTGILTDQGVADSQFTSSPAASRRPPFSEHFVFSLGTPACTYNK